MAIVDETKEILDLIETKRAQYLTRFVKPVKTKTSANEVKAKAIAKAISASRNICSGGKKDVAKILSIALGFTIDVSTSSEEFNNGDIVVCLTNPNSHNYPVGKPILLINSTVAVSPTMIEGNDAPTDYSGATRLATIEEANLFFDAIKTFYTSGYVTAKNAKKYLK